MIVRTYILLPIGLVTVTKGFVVPAAPRTPWRQQQQRLPSLEFLRRKHPSPTSSRLAYSNENQESDNIPIITSPSSNTTKAESNKKQAQSTQHHLILPNSYNQASSSKPINATSSSVDSTEITSNVDEAPEPLHQPWRLRKRVQHLASRIKTQWKLFYKSQKVLNPGMKFRVRVGLATIMLASVLSFFLPATRAAGGAKGLRSVLAVLTRWLSGRGFQGIAALGRSIAYGWALFVGYPRLLDRRAKEKKKRERERALERWRAYLRSLAAEVVRLRQELSSIDSEIRAFRREIISLKASLNKYDNGRSIASSDDSPESTASTNSAQWNDGIQEAITQEMTHLTQLREDTKQALAAARQIWSEMRAKSPLEAWEADDFLLVASPDSLPPTL